MPTSTPAIADKRYIDYYFVAHPDDEMEGWAVVETDPLAYPVIVLMTRGENSDFCVPSGYAQGYQPQYGELAPNPVPLDKGPTCASARIDSFTNFLNALAQVDPKHDDMVTGSPIVANGPPPDPACGVTDTSYEAWIAPHHTRLVLNIGDGYVKPCHVAWALQTARTLVPRMPVSKEMNAMGGSYYGDPSVCGSMAYTNPDHAAIATALRTTSLGVPGRQFQMVCRADNATAAYVLPQTIRDALFPSQTGDIQKYYGWLTVSSPPLPSDCCYSFQNQYYEWFYITP